MELFDLDYTAGCDNFTYERYLAERGFMRVAGCDEVGRGPLAGPVIAASVILPPSSDFSSFLDSKVLSHKKRQILFDTLHETGAKIGIGIVSEKDIDTLNILQASLLAMKISCENLGGDLPEYLLVDGKFEVPVSILQKTLIKGESKSASIAAASIIAKVTRDKFMVKMHEKFPHYNFAQNKGYPTREHREAVKKYGPSPIHRFTFKGVKEYAQ